MLLRRHLMVSVHTTCAAAMREAQALQGARQLRWVPKGMPPTQWEEPDQQPNRTWEIRRTLIDP